jgi:thiol-disulfide isomerase/thioredoxin
MSYRKLSTIGITTQEKFDVLVPEIQNKEDKQNMLNAFKICLIDVYADWCGPCKLTAPAFTKLFKNYNLNGVVGIAKENVELGLSPNVQVIPTFQFIVDGKLESIITGADMDSVEQKLITLIQNIDGEKK